MTKGTESRPPTVAAAMKGPLTLASPVPQGYCSSQIVSEFGRRLFGFMERGDVAWNETELPCLDCRLSWPVGTDAYVRAYPLSNKYWRRKMMKNDENWFLIA
jgi:hypothetical protein